MAQSVHLECCLRGKVIQENCTLTTLKTSSNSTNFHKAAFLGSSLHNSFRRIREELELSHTFCRTSRCALRSQSSTFIRQPLRHRHDHKKNKDPCRTVQRKSSNGGSASSDDSKKVGPAQSKMTRSTFIHKTYQICKPLIGALPKDLPVGMQLVPQHCHVSPFVLPFSKITCPSAASAGLTEGASQRRHLASHAGQSVETTFIWKAACYAPFSEVAEPDRSGLISGHGVYSDALRFCLPMPSLTPLNGCTVSTPYDFNAFQRENTLFLCIL